MKHALVLTVFLALNWSSPGLADAAVSAAPERPVAFRIIDSSVSSDGGTRYLADAGKPAMPCTFEIIIGKSKPSGGGPFGFAPATLVRRPGADCAPFLKDLAGHLGFKGRLPAPKPTDKLVTSVAVLGTKQSRGQVTEGGGWILVGAARKLDRHEALSCRRRRRGLSEPQCHRPRRGALDQGRGLRHRRHH